MGLGEVRGQGRVQGHKDKDKRKDKSKDKTRCDGERELCLVLEQHVGDLVLECLLLLAPSHLELALLRQDHID